MSSVRWMDFYGCPPILLPERLRGSWNGHHVQVDIDEEEDFVLPDGRGFCIRDEYDFKTPTTDYERLCATRGGSHFLLSVGDGEALAIGEEAKPIGWWPEQRMLVTLSHVLLDQSTLDRLTWTDEVRWNIPPGRLLLLNSSRDAGDPDLMEQFVDFITLPSGEYSIETAYHADYWRTRLYRFREVA